MNLSKGRKLYIALFFGLTSAAVSAAVFQSHVYTYYSDASKTIQVGEERTYCGTMNSWTEGQQTPFYTVKSEVCSTNGGGDGGTFCRYYADDPNC